MNQILIRQAAESDIQSISRLQQQWFEEGSVYGLVPESQEQVRAALNPYLLVAEADNEVAGFVAGSIRSGEGTAVIPAGESYLRLTTCTSGRSSGGGASAAASLLNFLLKQNSKAWLMPCCIRRPKTYVASSVSTNGTTFKVGTSGCSGSCNRARGGLTTR